MAQSFLPQQRDARTFGAMQARLIDDLNRPDLGNVVIDYLRDAVRFWSRKAFFFTELDNREVPQWQPDTMYPLGSTVHARSHHLHPRDDAFVAVSRGTQKSGSDEPEWSDDVYTPWPGSNFFEPPDDDEWGITVDGDVRWANIGWFKPGYHTQLSTVPNVNRYTPPIDYTSPYQVQMTTANQRLRLEYLPFEELSRYDVIQPAPIAAYPRFWAFWGQEIYFWVYPAGFYPITFSYNCAPIMPIRADESNYWTTTGERLIRKYAQAAISREVLYDQSAAQLSMSAATEELAQLKAQAVAQQGYRIPPSGW